MKKLLFNLMLLFSVISTQASGPKYLYINGTVINVEEIDSITFTTEIDERIELELPIVPNPGVGKTTVVLYVPEETPNGCYAVGTINDWDVTNTDMKFVKVEGAEDDRWMSYTFDYSADMEIKVCAIPHDFPNWCYQWGNNIDSESDIDGNNVIILQGDGTLVLEGSEPKLTALKDGGVIFILVKDWVNPVFANTQVKDITVKAKVPATWTNTIMAWVWPTGCEGREVVPTKEGDWYVVTENCAVLNILFKNGEGWTGEANQTEDMDGIIENTCFQIKQEGTTKATATVVDCE